MSEPWFSQKRYGFGAAPATWQGWAATVLFILLVVGGSAVLRTLLDPGPSRVWAMLAWTVALTAGFARFVHGRTEGGWRWRWGD